MFYVVLTDGTTAPTSDEVHDHSTLGIVAYGSDENLSADTETSLSISGLTASTDYDVWVVLEYSETLQATPTKIDISTDITAPSFASDYPSVSGVALTELTLKMKADEDGTGYYVVLTNDATAPSSAEVKAGTGSAGDTEVKVKSGDLTLKESVENSESITGLAVETSYDIYGAVEDANGNLSDASKVEATTLALPKEYYVSSTGLKPDGITAADYSTISEAISAVSSTTTDTIIVYDGTYTENISFGGKDIVLKSYNGPASTIITPSNNGLAIVWFYSGESSKSRLVGFTLTGGGALQGSALNIETAPVLR